MYENHTCSCMVIIHFAPKGLRFYCPRAATRAPGSRSAAFLFKSRRVCPHWANPPSVVFVNGRRLSFLSARTGHPPPFMFLPGPGHPETAAQAGGSPQPAPHTCRAADAYFPSSSSSFCSRASASNPAATIFPSGAMSNVWGMDLTPYTSPATHCQPFRSDR